MANFLIDHEYTLDITPSARPQLVHVSEYDVGRRFTFTITQGGEEFLGLTPSVGNVTVEGTIGSYAFSEPASIENGKIVFQLTESMTAHAGKAWTKIKFANADAPVSSCAFWLVVDRAGVEAETVIGADGFQAQINTGVAAWMDDNRILYDATLQGRSVGRDLAPDMLESDWASGSIDSTDGMTEVSSTRFIRSPMYAFVGRFRFSGVSRDTVGGTNYTRPVYVYCYDSDRAYLGRVYATLTPSNGMELLDGTMFVRVLYGFHADSGLAVADYGLSNLAADFRAEFIGGLEYAEKQERSVIGAIADVAETYLNEAYSADNQIIYAGGHGIFSDNLTVDGVKATSCSQFFKAIITGTRYENSRFELAENYPSWWGYEYDNSTTATFVGSRSAMDSHQIAKYCEEKGWLVPFDADHNNIRPGDLMFWTNEDYPTNYLTIHHVAICLQTFDGGCYYINAGANYARPVDGEDAGVDVHKQLWTDVNPKYQLAYYARLPMLVGEHTTRLIMKDDADHNGSYSDSNVSVAVFSFDSLPLGFYTMSWTDDGNGTPYLKVNPDGINVNFEVFRCGKNVYCVFYATEPIAKLNIRSKNGSTYDVHNVRLYKGCKTGVIA